MSETAGQTIIEGQNLFLFKKKGSDWNSPVMLGCLTGLTFKLDSEAIEVMCDANGNLPENIYGKQNGTLSISGVYKKYSTAEQANNFGGDELQIAQETKSFIDLQWGNVNVGDTVKRANVMITSYQETHQNSQVSTYTAELKINGAISRATIPAA